MSCTNIPSSEVKKEEGCNNFCQCSYKLVKLQRMLSTLIASIII